MRHSESATPLHRAARASRAASVTPVSSTREATSAALRLARMPPACAMACGRSRSRDRRTRSRWRPASRGGGTATRDSAADGSSISWHIRRISRNDSTMAGSVRGSATAARTMCSRSTSASLPVHAQRAPRAPRAAAVGAIKRSRQRARRRRLIERRRASSRLQRAAASASANWPPPAVSASARADQRSPASPPTPRSGGRSRGPASAATTSRGRHRSAGHAADDQVRPGVLGGELEQRERRVRRETACRSRRPRASDPSATPAIASAPAPAPRRARRRPSARSRRAAPRARARAAPAAHARADGSSRSSARGRPSRASATPRETPAATSPLSLVTPPCVAFPHFDPRSAAQIEVDQPGAAAHGEERRQRAARAAAHVPANRRAGGEIQRASAGNEIAIEHQHAARQLQTEGPSRIGASPP